MTSLNLALVLVIAILVALLCMVVRLDLKYRRYATRRFAELREENAGLLSRLSDAKDARVAAEARLAPFTRRERGAGGKFVKGARS